jgi:hypothetical protein
VAGREDIAVVAISYDPVATLAEFAEDHGVTYPLLADVGSVQIKRLGLVNDNIVAERLAWGREMDDKHRDLPYPGTFLLDESGVVIEKKFERSHRLRPSGTVLIEALIGEAPAPAVSGTDAAPGVQGAAWLDETTFFPGQRLYAHVRLQVDPGLHLYVPPIAEGYIPVTVTMAPVPELTVEKAALPEGTPFRVEGLTDEFQVVEGEVDIRVPFYFSDEATDDATLAVRIGYQACTEEVCFAPEELRIDLPIKQLPIPHPEPRTTGNDPN